MKRFSLVIVYQTCLLLLAAGAWADAPANTTWTGSPDGSVTDSSVNMDRWMDLLSRWFFGGSYPFVVLNPTVADLNENGVLDVHEFALFTAICNDTTHPLHDTVHEAFKTNLTNMVTHLGTTVAGLANPLQNVCAAYATIGDGDYQRVPSALAPWFKGSWGVAAYFVFATAGYGSQWAAGQPNSALYNRQQALLSMCGDFDSDGIRNIDEYYGQGGDRNLYVTAANNPSITTSGFDPNCVCSKKVNFGVTHFYNPTTQKVYWLVPHTLLTWSIQQQEAQNHSLIDNLGNTIPIPGNLVKIDDAVENTWIVNTIWPFPKTNPTWNPTLSRNLFIGGTDMTVEGTWIWISTGETFWLGTAGGSCVGSYCNWNPGEPNAGNADEDYAEMRSTGTWYDVRLANYRRGLVEFEATYPDTDSDGIPDYWEQFMLVPVPNVVGMTQTDAENAITSAGLTTGTITEQCHNTVPAGSVISQNPAGGQYVVPGASVNLSVSTGPCPITVPDVVGMTQSDAESAIISAGLTVGTVSEECSDTVPAGSVISQNPAGGISVPPATPVNLVVANGPCTTLVPDVVGMTQSDAESAIISAGLTVGTITEQCSDTVPAGSVISQDPEGNERVNIGTPVDLIISTGHCPRSVPNVMGMTQSEAASAIESAGLAVGSVSDECSETVEPGKVLAQTPGPGMVVPYGSSVNIVLAKDPTPISDNQGPVLVATLMSLSSQLETVLENQGMASWDRWDIEYLEQVIGGIRPIPGDGLRDSWSMALLEYCLCHPEFRPDLDTEGAFAYNKDLFIQDCNLLATQVDPIFASLPPLIGDVMPGLLGSSVEMRTTLNALILLLTGGATGFPNVNNYRIYGISKTGGTVSASGDPDNDGLTNLQEAQEVIAYGGDVDTFVWAATDPTNAWKGGIPVATITTIVIVSICIAILGMIFLIQYRKKNLSKTVIPIIGIGICLGIVAFGAWADAPANFTWSNAPGGPVTASTVDFQTWMTKLSQFQFGGDYVFDFLDPTVADNNDNDVLDINEFALLTAICNNTAHPQHDLIHEAFKTNMNNFGADQGSLVNSLASALKIMGAAYATVGDGDYGRTPAPWFTGSWGSVAEMIYELRNYGSTWNSGEPSEPRYQRRQAYMSMCGDFDGDGVKNINEWYGQEQSVPGYVMAAMNPAITTSGEDPNSVCETGIRWGKTYFYNPANQHVYWLQPYTLPWEIAEQVATEHSLVNNANETIAIPGHLVTIDDSAENAWIMSTVYPQINNNMWIGATDKNVEGQWIWIGTGEQFWQGAAGGNPVGGKYANWNGGEPNDAGGAEDYGEFTSGGGWNDNKASATRRGLVEFPNAYPDSDTNGIPDFWEQFSGGGGEGEGTPEGTPEGSPEGTPEGEEPCEYDGLINNPTTGQGPLLASTLINANPQIAVLLNTLGMTNWFNWDIEYLEEVMALIRPLPGDMLKDAWSMALLEYCLCHPNFRSDLNIPEDFGYNKTLFTNDCNWLAANVDPIFAALPPMVGDVMAGLLGSSVEMRTTWNAIFLALTGGAVGLPSVNNYRIYGMAKANDGAIAANGDLDGDGKTNLEEASEVIAVGGGMELFVKAATDKTNMWPGNPEIPVGTLATLGAVTGLIIAGGSILVVRRRKSAE